MAKISISLPDDLVLYVDEHVGNRSALIEKLLAQWKQDSENEELVKACAAVDELGLGWDTECQNAAIMDLEASGL
jgi:metal-responsive CopG/Arc/MetJ family transcriptional regulator